MNKNSGKTLSKDTDIEIYLEELQKVDGSCVGGVNGPLTYFVTTLLVSTLSECTPKTSMKYLASYLFSFMVHLVITNNLRQPSNGRPLS